ncbi:uncharacterized protein LOC119373615 [Rhipicephalus sanguineus]|uniref:uncharacterized protein LOC119373615 n=1 Tax=Rhipicephalus sanguineus TaxID=34632 RepID=UPI001893A4FF|nr:uncharacterized protein LOC119373615 [Rhipicephalus sanguineus]
MVTHAGLVFVAFAILRFSAAEESCSVPTELLERATRRLITALPETFPFPGDEEAPVVPGLFAGPSSLLGLNHLRVLKPYRVYCEESNYGEAKKMVSVDFTTNQNKGLALNFPWRYCGGKSGTVKLDLRKIRFTVIFEVVNKADEEEVTLRAVELHPVWMEDIVPYVEGLGSFGAQAGVAFSKIFPQVLRDLWVNILPTFVARIMQDTSRHM